MTPNAPFWGICKKPQDLAQIDLRDAQQSLTAPREYGWYR